MCGWCVIDVADLEGGHLRDPQPGTIGGAEGRPVLRPGGRLEQPADLLDAEHGRQLARVAHNDEAARQVRPIERHREEEAQCRHGAIDALWLHTTLGLVDLETADVLGRCRVRWPPEERREAPHETDVVTLCVFAQATHGHVFEHAPPQRAHGLGNCLGGHLVFSLS